jgi:hypothetical protein
MNPPRGMLSRVSGEHSNVCSAAHTAMSPVHPGHPRSRIVIPSPGRQGRGCVSRSDTLSGTLPRQPSNFPRRRNAHVLRRINRVPPSGWLPTSWMATKSMKCPEHRQPQDRPARAVPSSRSNGLACQPRRSLSLGLTSSRLRLRPGDWVIKPGLCSTCSCRCSTRISSFLERSECSRDTTSSSRRRSRQYPRARPARRRAPAPSITGPCGPAGCDAGSAALGRRSADESAAATGRCFGLSCCGPTPRPDAAARPMGSDRRPAVDNPVAE